MLLLEVPTVHGTNLETTPNPRRDCLARGLCQTHCDEADTATKPAQYHQTQVLMNSNPNLEVKFIERRISDHQKQDQSLPSLKKLPLPLMKRSEKVKGGMEDGGLGGQQL